ncbi:MAG: SDR family NAD(P)-dependent oxidoreductase [Calditrichaeota bacterium]|nr:MAG: SDR family NAD(P)-dependent oxidoreductase [Calditrichota bacterium]
MKMNKEKNVFIVGATSGIGLAIAEIYLRRGAKIAGFGRNSDKLEQLEEAYPDKFYGFRLDICDHNSIFETIPKAIEKVGPADILIVSSSINNRNSKFSWTIERQILDTNVLGYAAVLNFAVGYFLKQNRGHLVGITSIAKYISNRNPSYSASKVFESNYLNGIRLLLADTKINITEIIPGFVDTPLIENRDRVFWVTPVDKAARQIIRAIDKKKKKAFISKRWMLIRLIIPFIPFSVMKKILK